MQAPYQTFSERYLGFRELVAGLGAIVCTIAEDNGLESLAWSGIRRLNWVCKPSQP
jgi:hypothetical protein